MSLHKTVPKSLLFEMSNEVPGKVLFNETPGLSFLQDIKSGLYLITSPQGSVSLKQKPFIDNEDLECLWLIYHS